MLTNYTTVFGLVLLFISAYCLENDSETSGKKEEKKTQNSELLKEIINEEKKLEGLEKDEKLVRSGKSKNENGKIDSNKAEIFEISDIEAIEKASQTNAKKNKELMKDAIVFPTEEETTTKSTKEADVRIIYPPLKSLIKTIRVIEVPRRSRRPVKNVSELKENSEKETNDKGKLEEKKAAIITDEHIKTLQSLLEDIRKERLLLEKANNEKNKEQAVKIKEENIAKKSEDVVEDKMKIFTDKVLSQNEKPLESATVVTLKEKLTTPSTEILLKKTIQYDPTITTFGILSGPQSIHGFGFHQTPSLFTHYPYHSPPELGFRQSKSHDKRVSELKNEIKDENIPQKLK